MYESNYSSNSLPCSPINEQSSERRKKRCDDDCPKQRYDPGTSYFTSMVTPVTNLFTTLNSNGCVEFIMRRKNKTVTLQWEPFGGSISANGIEYLTVTQSICNTPPYPLSFSIPIQYKAIDRTVKVTIDPHSKNGNIFYYLNTDGSAANINVGDSFYIYGGSVSWIVC
jgi:hypothetical protein